MKRPRAVIRAARIVILLGVVLTVALFLRGHSTLTIPPGDTSMEPTYPAGSKVILDNLDEDDPIERGMDVVYSMDLDGVSYARFGRVQGLPGDVVGVAQGHLAVNGALVGPARIPGPSKAVGRVPPGEYLVLAINPGEGAYKDSRELGFIPRERIRARIRASIGG